MQGWHDKQVGVGTQPYRFPLLPKGPDTTQGLSLWLLTLDGQGLLHLQGRTAHHISARKHYIPTTHSLERLTGASVSPTDPKRLGGIPPPALSSDYPSK